MGCGGDEMDHVCVALRVCMHMCMRMCVCAWVCAHACALVCVHACTLERAHVFFCLRARLEGEACARNVRQMFDDQIRSRFVAS